MVGIFLNLHIVVAMLLVVVESRSCDVVTIFTVLNGVDALCSRRYIEVNGSIIVSIFAVAANIITLRNCRGTQIDSGIVVAVFTELYGIGRNEGGTAGQGHG